MIQEKGIINPQTEVTTYSPLHTGTPNEFVPKKVILDTIDMFEESSSKDALISQIVQPFLDGIRKAVNMLPTIKID